MGASDGRIAQFPSGHTAALEDMVNEYSQSRLLPSLKDDCRLEKIRLRESKSQSWQVGPVWGEEITSYGMIESVEFE